jgi:hypothetical protein
VDKIESPVRGHGSLAKIVLRGTKGIVGVVAPGKKPSSLGEGGVIWKGERQRSSASEQSEEDVRFLNIVKGIVG